MAQKRAAGIIVAIAAGVSLAACSIPPSKVSLPRSAGARPSQTGIASWYGPGFHGKPTAAGNIYDQNEITAAHQTLPLGTRVRVTNLDNSRSIDLVINDRGPFAKGRILDLSYGAGKALGMIGPGTVPVRLEVIESPRPLDTVPATLDYTLQIGSFTQIENARQLRDRLAASYPDAAIVPFQASDRTYFRVQVGTFSERAVAEEQARRVAHAGLPVLVMEK